MGGGRKRRGRPRAWASGELGGRRRNGNFVVVVVVAVIKRRITTTSTFEKVPTNTQVRGSSVLRSWHETHAAGRLGSRGVRRVMALPTREPGCCAGRMHVSLRARLS